MGNEKIYQAKCYVSDYDQECIQNSAKICDKIVSAYIRESASNFCTLKYNWHELCGHGKILSSLRNAVNGLFLFVRDEDHYVSIDLELILKTMNEIIENEGDLFRLMLFDCDKKRKVIIKETRKIVGRHLEREERR